MCLKIKIRKLFSEESLKEYFQSSGLIFYQTREASNDMSSNNMSSKGSFGGVLNESNDNFEFEWDNNESTIETIGTMVNEIERKKRRLSNYPNNDQGQKVLKASYVSPSCDRNPNINRQQKISSHKANLTKKLNLLFKVHENPEKSKIEQYLLSNARDVQIEDFKITANNVLVYTNSNEDNEVLVNKTSLLEGKSRLNLNNIDKRPYLILKSVTFDFIKYKLEELNSLGIVDVIEMKSKVTNKSYNLGQSQV